MTAKVPVLPIAGATVLRASLSALALVAHWLKELVRRRRHRREARALAALDRNMLTDIGITRSDVRDAFSEPFWQDPTVLLKERAGERRRNRSRGAPQIRLVAGPENGFHRPPTNRPVRQAL